MFWLVDPLRPPATNTIPLVVEFDPVLSWVAVCRVRAPVMLAVAAHVPVDLL
ncbi:MAG TPA: hypothetical protein VLC06_11415 [Polyangia bacterium]|nr:hypothetical protein [Polyangia bacterium]